MVEKIMPYQPYVTQNECAERREKCEDETKEQNKDIIILKTELAFVKRMMWMILSVLIGGFGGVIFAVLSLGH